MRRSLALVAAVSFVFAFFGAATAIHVLLPTAVAASLSTASTQSAVSDRGGTVRLWWGLRDGGATIYLAAPDGIEQVRLSQGPEDGAAVVLSDGAGLPRIVHRIAEETGPVIMILDEDGEVVWSAP